MTINMIRPLQVETYLKSREMEKKFKTEIPTTTTTTAESAVLPMPIDSPTKNSANNEQSVLQISNTTANINNNNCTRLI